MQALGTIYGTLHLNNYRQIRGHSGSAMTPSGRKGGYYVVEDRAQEEDWVLLAWDTQLIRYDGVKLWPTFSRVAEVEDSGEEEERQCANMPKAWSCWEEEEADGIMLGVLGIPVVASVSTPLCPLSEWGGVKGPPLLSNRVEATVGCVTPWSL